MHHRLHLEAPIAMRKKEKINSECSMEWEKKAVSMMPHVKEQPVISVVYLYLINHFNQFKSGKSYSSFATESTHTLYNS